MDHAPESAHYDSLTGISNEDILYCEEIGTDEENSDTAVEAFDLVTRGNAERERDETAWKASKLKCRQLERKCPQTTRWPKKNRNSSNN